MNAFFYDTPRQTLIFFFFGAVIGLLYDAFRILHSALRPAPCRAPASFLRKIAPPSFRKRKKERPIIQKTEAAILFAEDILFFLLLFVGYSTFVYLINDGELRLWSFVLFLLGFIAYRLSLGKIVFGFSDTILFFIKILISWLLYIIMKPIRFLIRKGKHLYGRTREKVQTRCWNARRLASERRLKREMTDALRKGPG